MDYAHVVPIRIDVDYEEGQSRIKDVLCWDLTGLCITKLKFLLYCLTLIFLVEILIPCWYQFLSLSITQWIIMLFLTVARALSLLSYFLLCCGRSEESITPQDYATVVVQDHFGVPPERLNAAQMDAVRITFPLTNIVFIPIPTSSLIFLSKQRLIPISFLNYPLTIAPFF